MTGNIFSQTQQCIMFTNQLYEGAFQLELFHLTMISIRIQQKVVILTVLSYCTATGIYGITGAYILRYCQGGWA